MELKMVLILVLIGFFVSVFSGPVPGVETASEEDIGLNMKYFLVETREGVYEVEDLVNAEAASRVSQGDITYHFYSKNNPSRGTDIKSNNIAALKSTEFKVSKDTLFITHGWKNHNESDINRYIREAALSKHDINVFVVDWSPVAKKNYVSAKNAVVKVGYHVASFIRSLVSTYGLQLSKVALVGHSLGAHVSGNAGAALDGQVDHIVGLDPALPLFSIRNIDDRLDPTDAKFVQVMHTNGGLLGFSASIGHADYFPNGGSSQPGCGLDVAGACSHLRAFAYYAESISSADNLFISTQCGSYRHYSRGRCSSNANSVMGGYGVDTRANGDYYLDTNKASPYAKS